MKKNLLKVLDQIKDDADFYVYEFLENSVNYKAVKKKKSYVANLIQKAETIYQQHFEDCLMIAENIGVSVSSFNDNIYFETNNTDGFMNYISKYNKYHNVFIRLDKENKTIEFKLGDRYKKLELIENTDYVHKPHYSKWMKIVSVGNLEKHISDDFWNPGMVEIGRKVLGIKNAV